MRFVAKLPDSLYLLHPLHNAPLQFEMFAKDSATGARCGRITTRHGVFDTPAFMPVGTQGSVKGLTPAMVKESGAKCILANTYHLMLRPGEEAVAELGDLHSFMAWPGPILTDSGGFQVFSLADCNTITDEGVTFKSHIDGSMQYLDARRSMKVQNALGADIIMAFDECPAADAPLEYQRTAVERTLRWAKLSIEYHARSDDQSLFAIVQGGTNSELRRYCAEKLIAMDFPGYAMGGLAVGEGFEAMKAVLADAVPMLPEEKPRYLMGVGFPQDIAVAVAAGIDMFDCTIPTRNGRNAYAFTAKGPIRIKNARFTREKGPIEEGCGCYACLNFTCGAIRHFFFAGEMLGPVLVSAHNVWFYQKFMADIRQAISIGSFGEFLRDDPRCRLGPVVDESLTDK